MPRKEIGLNAEQAEKHMMAYSNLLTDKQVKWIKECFSHIPVEATIKVEDLDGWALRLIKNTILKKEKQKTKRRKI